MFFKDKKSRLLIFFDFLILLATYIFLIFVDSFSSPDSLLLIGAYATQLAFALVFVGATRWLLRTYEDSTEALYPRTCLSIVISDFIGGSAAVLGSYVLSLFGICAFVGVWQSVTAVLIFTVGSIFIRLVCGVKAATPQKQRVTDFNIEELLPRNEIELIDRDTEEFYTGKTILVTGGGGSIGSELVRQVAGCKPRKLILFDIYENNAYDIEQELLHKYGKALELVVEIGSVRERARLEAVFAAYRPDIVFHAAAHKHVPLMEHSNCEAIKNNIFGTYNAADMAEKYGVKKFILISTDKAVNPTNIMGATKRLCEMIVECRAGGNTVFSAVRFGNVLGSNGSVIPLFRRQIMSGGPITIADKRIIRYFMTIPEASGLVMQAGAMAKSGELFVLDMGKPVRIYELAENMIRLCGLTPYKDIDIIETGLRPGEKLYEEMLIKTEHLLKTKNDLIYIEKDSPPTREEVEEKIAILKEAVKNAERDIQSPLIVEALMRVVPSFHTPDEVNRRACESEEMRSVEQA